MGIRQCRVEVSTGFPGPFPTFSDWSPTTTTLPSFRSYNVLRYVGPARNCDHNRGGGMCKGGQSHTGCPVSRRTCWQTWWRWMRGSHCGTRFEWTMQTGLEHLP